MHPALCQLWLSKANACQAEYELDEHGCPCAGARSEADRVLLDLQHVTLRTPDSSLTLVEDLSLQAMPFQAVESFSSIPEFLLQQMTAVRC